MTKRARWLPVLLLVAACRSATATTPPVASGPDPRDVTRPDLPPPMYRQGSDDETRVAITSNAYGAYRWAPKAPQLGDRLPDFELPEARGGTWSLREARAKGPVVVVFYRGFW